jgi:tetratricopeptide (TPR) repeat protein
MVGFNIDRRGLHAPRRNKPFVGRKKPIETFRIALSQPQSTDPRTLDGYRILAWDGPGGLGKSRLCAELIKEITERQEYERAKEKKGNEAAKIALGHLDFQSDERRDRITALRSLRQQLAASGKIKTPAFTYALACLFEVEFPGVDIRQKYPEMFRSDLGQGGDDIFAFGWDLVKSVSKESVEEVIKFLPGANIVVRNARKGLNKALDLRELAAISATIEDIEAMRVAKDKAGLRNELARCLGEDLRRAMEAEKAPPRVVLMFDTYEALWGSAKSDDDLSADEWVRGLIMHAPGAMVSVFGRKALRWAEIDPNWEPFVRSQRLEDLSVPEAQEYLRKSGVPDEDVRNRIVAASTGLPFYLDLSVEIYHRIRSEGRMPEVEDFAPAKAQILERFISGLDMRQRQELMVASYPDQLSDASFAHLADNFLGGLSTTDWPGIKRQSFVTQVGDGYRLHNLMREALQKRDRGQSFDQFVKIHRGMHTFHASRLPVDRLCGFSAEDEANFHAAHGHLIKCDLDEATEWLAEQSQDSFRSGRWTAIHDAHIKTIREYKRNNRPLPPSMKKLRKEIETRHYTRMSLQNAIRLHGGPSGVFDLREEIWDNLDTIETPGKNFLGQAGDYLENKYRHLFAAVSAFGGRRTNEFGSYHLMRIIQRLVDLAMGFHQIDRDKDARNALVLVDKVMKLFDIDPKELARLPGYDMERGVSLYRAGKSKEAEEYFARAENGRRQDIGFGGTRLALHRSLNLVAMGEHTRAMAVMDAEIARLETDADRSNRALGFAYMARADVRLDGRTGDHGEADLERAIQLWKGPILTSQPTGQRAMSRKDPLMEEAEDMLIEARLLNGKLHSTVDGVVRRPRSEAPRTMWDRTDWRIPGTRENAALLEEGAFNFDPETELRF